MVTPALWDISLHERQQCVCVGRSGSDVASVSGGGGTSGNGFCRIIVDEFWYEVGGRAGAESSLLNRHGH